MLGSHSEKNRPATHMYPKATESSFLLSWIYLLVCSQYKKTCEFAMFWAQILRAVAVSSAGPKVCSLYKIRALGHSPGLDFFQFLIKLIREKLQLSARHCLRPQTLAVWTWDHCYRLWKERDLYCILHKIATYIQRLQAKQRHYIHDLRYAKPNTHMCNAHKFTLAAVGKHELWYAKWNVQ